MLLWSGTLSPFSAKIRIYLNERGLPHTIEEIPWNRETLWGPKPGNFLAANPRGEVPTLMDGDIAVFDSTLIWEYLEDAYPDNPLAPSAPAERAACRARTSLTRKALATADADAGAAFQARRSVLRIRTRPGCGRWRRTRSSFLPFEK